jgi:hypothetical protein
MPPYIWKTLVLCEPCAAKMLDLFNYDPKHPLSDDPNTYPQKIETLPAGRFNRCDFCSVNIEIVD